MAERSLAHIEKVTNLEPIPNYDRVELATILGWKVVVRKGEFQVNDLCCYFEIDSKLKETEWSEFLRSKNFKIKTQKMCKVISQGLALPLNVIPELKDKTFEVGTDVTELLGVTYAEPADNVRKAKVDPNAKYNSMASRHKNLFKKKPIRWLMKRKWGKKLLFFFFGKKKDIKDTSFPSHFEFIHKTDECRCENIPNILSNKDPWIVTTKIDGTSSTYILERRQNKKYFKRNEGFEFYVTSRNVRQLAPDKGSYVDQIASKDGNVYWDMAFKYKIREFLEDVLNNNPNFDYVCLQGEIAGPNIQGNPHKLKEVQFFGFNFIDSVNGRWNSVEAAALCQKYGIQWVPIVDFNYILPDTMEELKLQADGPCDVEGSSGLREGFVYRSLDGKNSFKNVSREYLLKH